MNTRVNTLWRKFWYDAKGRLVLWQWPNVPLFAWGVFLALAKVAQTGALHNGAQFVSSAALVVWAYLEITGGANYFRRSLGAVILVATIASHTR